MPQREKARWTARLNFQITPADMERIREAATTRGVMRSIVARQAITEWLERNVPAQTKSANDEGTASA